LDHRIELGRLRSEFAAKESAWKDERAKHREIKTELRAERETHLAKIGGLEGELNSLRERSSDADKRIASVEGERDAAESNSRHNVEMSAYGRRITDTLRLDPADVAVTRAQISELGPALEEMYNQAEITWRLIASDAGVSGETSASYWLHLYIHNNEFDFAYRVGKLFFESLKARRDLRPILGPVCINYFNWRDKILLLGELTGTPANARVNYRKWRQAEIAFFEDLRRKLAVAELEPIKEQIRNHFAAHRSAVLGLSLPVEQLVLPPLPGEPREMSSAERATLEAEIERLKALVEEKEMRVAAGEGTDLPPMKSLEQRIREQDAYITTHWPNAWNTSARASMPWLGQPDEPPSPKPADLGEPPNRKGQ
jgi:hypothetical protein